jgi:diphosphomevalonate decarboxylase
MAQYIAKAPSNIALIKYMGKTTEGLPTNSSLSLTLPHLFTEIVLEKSESDQIISKINLSTTGKTKFINHLERMRTIFNVNEKFCITTENNFPSDAGIASSASSFAALTLAFKNFVETEMKVFKPIEFWAQLSAKGSGSSCRSFFSGLVSWKPSGEVLPVLDSINEFYHWVIILSESKKSVSSSEAHQRVTSSLLFSGRTERAEKRSEQLYMALTDSNWPLAQEICWAEYWDMHSLFHTSSPSFMYILPETIKTLKELKASFNNAIFTLDAGPNIHIVLPKSSKTTLPEAINNFIKSQNMIAISNYE